MRLTIPLTVKCVVIGCLGIGALGSAGCADGRGVPTSPGSSVASSAASPAGAFPRSGDLHITKECRDYRGAAGDFCTITSSNVKEIEVGTRIVYLSAAGFPVLDSDIVLNPGPGNNKAFGHCTLNQVTSLGLCTLSGGTGKFTHFRMSANVTQLAGVENWAWDGTYTFNPRD